MKRYHISILLIMLIIVFSYNSVHSKSEWISHLKTLGFYAVADGSAIKLDFIEYGSGSTKRQLPKNDHTYLKELNKRDFIILFGNMPQGPMGTTISILEYVTSGIQFEATGKEWSADGFFSLEPLSPVKGQNVLKLIPKDNMKNGLYFLHKYVGMNGDAYAGFQLKK